MIYNQRTRSLIGSSLILLSIVPILHLEALPSVDNIAHGAAESSIQGNELLIRPSDSAILNYRNFDIQKHETVRFQMEDASHRVLNRINSQLPSQIDGKLLSNGTVYLMNPAGIVFGPNSIVNVGALYAAAAHLSDQDFILGIDRFTNAQGIIEIYGTLSAKEIALIGRSILQKGSLLADEGNIILATAENVYIGKENGHLFLKCEKENLQDSHETSCFIECGTPESYLLHHTGMSKAKKIHLYAEKDSLVQVSGNLDAANLKANGVGGEVIVQGEVISLEAATINASGTNGGGTVLIGGGIHGEGIFPRAKYNLSDSDTSIHANATVNGNGGNIVLWADELIGFEAQLFSQGGPDGGDGGYIETSSGSRFNGMFGRVDASATHGKWGQWDLDPHSITIVNGSTNIPPGLTLADLNSSTPPDLDCTASAALLESAGANTTILMSATVPNPPAADNTFISLGTSSTPATVNITNANVSVIMNTNGGPGLLGKFFTNGSFTTTGPLVITAPVVLQGNTTLSSTANGVTFNLPINSDTATNHNLTINAQSGVIFQGAIGDTQPVGVLSIQTPAANVQCYGDISTTGNITFNSSLVTLNAPCAFTSSGGGIEFLGTVNSDTPSSNRNLTLSAAGDILFRKFVGLNPLGDLTIANAANVRLFSQPSAVLPPYTMTVRSFTQSAGTGDTSFEGALITYGAPVPQAAGTPPTAPRDGGNVSITTAGAINFYYLVQSGSPTLVPVLTPGPTDVVVYKSVITSTGGRQSSSIANVNNPNAPNGLNGGNVTLNGNTINLLAIYAGGTPAFPGSSGTGGKGGIISVTSTGGTALRGPIFATGGPGAGGGAQDYPTMVYSGQNLSAPGIDSPGNITITGPLSLGFNGVILRGSNITTGGITSQGINLLGIDASTAGVVQLGSLTNLSYFAIDYAKQATISGAVQAGGLDLFNAGDGFITFEQAVTATDIQAIANDFCVIFENGHSGGTSSFLNCGTCPSPPPPPPPPPGPPPSPPGPPPSPSSNRPHGRGFAGVAYPTFSMLGSSGSFLFYPDVNAFNNDDSYIQVPKNVFFLNYFDPPMTVDSLD